MWKNSPERTCLPTVHLKVDAAGARLNPSVGVGNVVRGGAGQVVVLHRDDAERRTFDDRVIDVVRPRVRCRRMSFGRTRQLRSTRHGRAVPGTGYLDVLQADCQHAAGRQSATCVAFGDCKFRRQRERLFTTCKHINNIQYNMFICSDGLPEGPEPIKAGHPLLQTT